MKYFFAIYAFLVIGILVMLGFRGTASQRTPLEIFPDMDRQFKFLEQGENTIFADGRNDRPVPAGTVPFIPEEQETYPHLAPKDRYYADNYFATGMIDGRPGQGFPVEIDNAAVARGQELFNIFCKVCHGESGDGNGITKSFGMLATASLIDPRVQALPEGHIFDVITNGFNTMGPYGHKIRPEDRWKIIAYVRALELSASATSDDVPAEMKGELGL